MSYDRESSHSDKPPYSRLFVVCSKDVDDKQVKDMFSEYGSIEDVWMPRDKVSKERKGIAYIKFQKTSQAAKALENLQGATLGSSSKPIKVMIAQSKASGSTEEIKEDERITRLFIVIPRDTPQETVEAEFKHFGEFDSVHIVRDRVTKEPRGCGYVKFYKPSNAALALEECDQKYKPVFAEPKSRMNKDTPQMGNKPYFDHPHVNNYDHPHSYDHQHGNYDQPHGMSNQMMSDNNMPHGVNKRLFIVCNNSTTQDQLYKLFDLIPGMEYCKLKNKHDKDGRLKCFAYVKYENFPAAIYAKDKLHGFEYPAGFRLTVKFAEELADSGDQHSIGGGGSNYTGGGGSNYTGGGGNYMGGGSGGGNYMGGSGNYMGGMGDLYASNAALGPPPPPMNNYSSNAHDQPMMMESANAYSGTDTGQLQRQLASLKNQVSQLCNAMSNNPGVQQQQQQQPPPQQQQQQVRGFSEYNDGPDMSGLPQRQPLAPQTSPPAERLFVVFQKQIPSMDFIQDVFCRFGNLIGFHMVKFKNYGYISYSTKDSAQVAVTHLHGKTYGGIFFKVMIAEPNPNSEGRKRSKIEESS